MQLHLITAVWGEEFINTFLNISLPSQLSIGNLPDLEKKCTPIYFIYIRLEDHNRIITSPIYQKLATYITVTFRFIEYKHNLSVHQNLNNCHSAAILEANKENAALLFLSPDLIVSMGFFHYLVTILNQGKRLIAGPGVRLSLENIEKELKAQNKLQERSPLSLTAKELTDLALKNLHPFSLNLFWENEIANTIFPNLYWWLSDTMILGRGFHIHPFVIWPTNHSMTSATTIDGSYAGKACPDKKHWHILTDTNEVAFFELSTNNRFIHSPIAKPSLERMALWAISNVHLIHRYYIKHKFYIGYGQRNANWDTIEKEADRVIDSILHPSWKLLAKRILIRMFLGIIRMIKIVFFINSPEKKVMVKKTIKRILPKIVFLQMKKVQGILDRLIH